MDIEQARKLLDAATMVIHQALNDFEQQTGMSVLEVILIRADVTGAVDPKPVTRLAAVQLEAAL